MNPVSYLETGVIYCDENLQRLAQFPDDCIDLIYLDPPFFSNRHYEVIWGDEAEVRSFEDRWEGGINVYINWMRERVLELHRVLKPTGVLFLHCDWHASHYIKIMLDNVFGPKQFLNELVWCYRGGGVSKKWFARKHDTIFFYGKKARQHHFEPQFVPYSDFTLARTKKTGLRPNRTAIDTERGGHMPDWWTDINALQTWSPERLGYPTQKPVALLNRIIKSASPEGATILDPFCGCGTAIVAANHLNRQWIGIDISPTAVGIMRQRMVKEGAEPKVIGMPVTEEQLRALKPFEFQNWVIQRIHGTHAPRKTGDKGIDGYSFMTHNPVQVKQSSGVGRNVVDNFETAVRREGKTKGYIVAFEFTRGAREEAARAKSDGLDIHLVKVADLLVDPTDIVAPRTDLMPLLAEDMVRDLLPGIRPAAARPTAEELIASDTVMSLSYDE